MRRPRPTTADYTVIAVSPALIMTLVGSLLFFLVEVFYQGQYEARLQFILAMFVMAGIAGLAVAAPTQVPNSQETDQSTDGPVDVGPLVGDQSVFVQEAQCQLQLAQDPANNLANYWPAIGAPEHVEGMAESEMIIAVNMDPNAPIFDIATYGIEFDFFDLIDPLLEQVEEAKEG